MTAEFIAKVMTRSCVDTRKYRYRAVPSENYLGIWRIDKKYLDTTAEIDGWELVDKLDDKCFWSIRCATWGGEPGYEHFKLMDVDQALRFCKRDYTDELILLRNVTEDERRMFEA